MCFGGRLFRSNEIVLFDHARWSQRSVTPSPRLMQARFTSRGSLIVSSETGTLRLYEPSSDMRLAGEFHELDGEEIGRAHV